MEPYGFFAMLSRMKYISRWGLMRNSRTENLSEHTLETAYFAHALALIEGADPARVVLCALYHDCSEILTGDLPTPIKYDNPDIQSAYQQVEAVAVGKLLSMLPEELRPAYEEALTIPDPEVRALVKAADKLSAYLKCVEELKAGNSEFKKAREQTYAALCRNPIPALSYFMEHFLDGFELTLDELN